MVHNCPSGFEFAPDWPNNLKNLHWRRINGHQVIWSSLFLPLVPALTIFHGSAVYPLRPDTRICRPGAFVLITHRSVGDWPLPSSSPLARQWLSYTVAPCQRVSLVPCSHASCRFSEADPNNSEQKNSLQLGIASSSSVVASRWINPWVSNA